VRVAHQDAPFLERLSELEAPTEFMGVRAQLKGERIQRGVSARMH